MKNIKRLALGIAGLGMAASVVPAAPAWAQDRTCADGYVAHRVWGIELCIPENIRDLLETPFGSTGSGSPGSEDSGGEPGPAPEPQPEPEPQPTPGPPRSPGRYRPRPGTALEPPDSGASTTPDGGFTDDVNPGDTPQTPPSSGIVRYKIEAVRFTASDESGADWAGSDEPMFTFTSIVGEDPVTLASPEFSNVDSGDTRTIEMCVIENCAEGFSEPLKLSIQLFEMDWGTAENTRHSVESAAKGLEWGAMAVSGDKVQVPPSLTNYLVDLIGNDLMGSLTLELDPAELINDVPVVGASAVRRYHLGGNSGDLPFEVAGGPDYHLELRITRLTNADAPETPNAGEAPSTGGGYRDLPGRSVDPDDLAPGRGGVTLGTNR